MRAVESRWITGFLVLTILTSSAFCKALESSFVCSILALVDDTTLGRDDTAGKELHRWEEYMDMLVLEDALM